MTRDLVSLRPFSPLLLALALAGCQSAHAAPAPAPSATPSALGSAAASAAAPVSTTPVKNQRFVPDLTVAPPAEEKSPKPSKQDWAHAEDAKEARITDPGCTVKRIREWVRVECNDTEVSLVAGEMSGVDVGGDHEQYKAWIVFPTRKGDRRVALFSFFFKWGLVQDAIVSEQWLEGDPGPLITVTGVPNGI